MTDLIRYDAMCTAIAECHRIDEVKDLRDKAMALALYARQADNFEAERRASEIRFRAERRAGELLKELARATPAEAASAGGHAKAGTMPPATVAGASPYREALTQARIAERAAQRYQELADVPIEAFEQALADPAARPSMRALIDKARKPQFQMPDDTLGLWGLMRQFERDGFLGKDKAALLEALTDPMRADVARLAPLMARFFTRLEEAIHELA